MVRNATGKLFCHVFINRNVKTKIFSCGHFILSAEKQPIKLSWRKIERLHDFLDNFKDILSKLYEHKDYKGGWDEHKIDSLLKDYQVKTDAIKKNYRDKKIVKLTGSSVNIVGGILSFTPLAPFGWGLLGIGSGMIFSHVLTENPMKNRLHY